MQINLISKKIINSSVLINKLSTKFTKKYIGKYSARRLDKLYFEICNKLSIRYFIDCGANDGSSSMQAIDNGLKSIAIEPNPYTYKNMIPKLSGQFKKINVGLSDKEEILKFYSLKNIKNATNASFKTPKKNLDKYDITHIQVFPLDKILKNNEAINNPFALWVDIEGMQKEFLNGSFETLKNSNCKLLKFEIVYKKNIEENEWDINKIENFLSNLGFEAIYRDYEYSYCYNVIFLKKDEVYNFKKEINSALRDVVIKINTIEVVKYLIYIYILRKSKSIIIKILGKHFGNKIAAFFGSKESIKLTK